MHTSRHAKSLLAGDNAIIRALEREVIAVDFTSDASGENVFLLLLRAGLARRGRRPGRA